MLCRHAATILLPLILIITMLTVGSRLSQFFQALRLQPRSGCMREHTGKKKIAATCLLFTSVRRRSQLLLATDVTVFGTSTQALLITVVDGTDDVASVCALLMLVTRGGSRDRSFTSSTSLKSHELGTF
jgi:hypothetical protein